MRRTEARARLQSANLAFCAKLNTFRQLFFRRSRCTIHSDLPTTAVTRADYRARNNWDFDPQGIECNSDACGMDSFDTCNSSFHLNHVRRFQLRSIAHIACSGADLKRQGEFSDVDVTIDITSTLVNVAGKVIVLLHLNGSTTQFTNCISDHFLMFLMICAVLQAKLEHGFADLRCAQLTGREVVSPNCPILKEKRSV